MEQDFIYENPPLVEVIVEVRWKLKSVENVPGAFIDQHYDLFVEKLEENLATDGFNRIEALIPNKAPIELFGS